MANEIVAPESSAHNAKNAHLLYQNTPLLAELLRLSYQDYVKHVMATQAFVANIQELVTALIEPTCQQNPHCPSSYLADLEQFNQYNHGDFIQYPDAIDRIAFTLARLVRCAIESFRALDYPKGYNEFLNLLESIFRNDSIIQQNQHRNVVTLFEQLRQKPWR